MTGSSDRDPVLVEDVVVAAPLSPSDAALSVRDPKASTATRSSTGDTVDMDSIGWSRK